MLPDVNAYNAAISDCGRCKQFQQVLGLVAEMRNASLESNVITYNAAISACEGAASCASLNPALGKQVAPDGASASANPVKQVQFGVSCVETPGGHPRNQAAAAMKPCKNVIVDFGALTNRQVFEAIDALDAAIASGDIQHSWFKESTLREVATRHVSGLLSLSPRSLAAFMRPCDQCGNF